MEIALVKSYTEKPWRSPETYQLIEDNLREKWSVQSIETKDPKTLLGFLTSLKREYGESVFVFNIAEYLDEINKSGFLPALLENWRIPHLGSSAETISIGLDKARTKELLSEKQIPTPPFFVANRDAPNNHYDAERIGYPLIVKPIREGGHIGIGEDSVVYNKTSLDRAVKRVFDDHNQPSLVEKYIAGKGMREFSVGIIDGETSFITPIEIDFESMDIDSEILSYDAAQNDLERTKLVHDEKIQDEIIDLTMRTFVAVGGRDYSRVDLRMNHTGCYVLEINTMPGMGPNGFLPTAAKAIYSVEYNQLIQTLAENSMKRQNIQ